MPESEKPVAKKNEKTDKKDQKKEEKDELSEEDLKYKQDIDLLVERVIGEEGELLHAALEGLRDQIKSSTGSMTAIPKALKFLRPHYTNLVGAYEKLPKDLNQKKRYADILSILSMTMSKPGSRETLRLKLEGNSEDIESWGHEYVRCLSAEIADEYTQRQADNQSVDDLLKLVEMIVPFNMKHNAEPEACDLLMEVDKLDRIIDQIDSNNYKRVCLYLLGCTYYVAEPEDTEILRIVMKIYRKVEQPGDALRVAMRLNDKALIQEIYSGCTDKTTKKQLACMLARQHVYLEEEEEDLKELLYNTNLSKYFLSLARDLDVMDPKTPDDIYKTHLTDSRAPQNQDSARNNLASIFVNAFVNAGFGVDKLMTTEGNKWIYKNKDHGMMSAAASLGMIMLWEVDNGTTQLDKFTYSREDVIKAGALLGTGVVSCGVRDEFETALNLLREHVTSQSSFMRVGAVLGLGIAYSGSARQELLELLLPVLEDPNQGLEVIGITALALGLIFVGTSNAEITSSIINVFFERDENAMSNTHSRFLCLGLGLLYLGTQELADLTLETLKTIKGPFGQYCSLTVETCAYAATGNVLKVQKLLDICGDHLEKNNAHQAVAVLGIALIAMGEELGAEMSLRSFDHLLQYGEPVVRRAVPLALGLLCISNPLVGVTDTLSKLSHDSDEEVSLTAILALGFIGAGTNNARIASMLRQLSAFYRQANHLFIIKIAQGLLHLGKGTMSLNPFHSDRLLLSNVSIGGLLTVLHASLDLQNTILSKTHYLLYTLATAMYPRMLMTFDEEMKPVATSVRVGQAVDTVGQAGKPKTITGFQTHTTPVLIATKERAELATDEYIPVTSILEGFVLLRKNPDSTAAQNSSSQKK